MKAPRIGIIGVRRNRQGLGPYVARFLREAGADVACFLGTRPETLEAARAELRQRFGIGARGYLDLGEMLRRETPDALAILSPARTHQVYLEAALEAGLHVLCEKPFVWGGRDAPAAARRIASGFEEKGLRLWENCHWPYTLPAYGKLHPGMEGRTPSRFEMLLSPISAGKEMLGDAMPHPISLLQALLPAEAVGIGGLHFSARQMDAPDITIEFRYRADSREVEARVRLIQSKAQPRAAGFGVNGHWARRLIRMENYAILFGDGPRLVEVPDPLRLLVSDFVRDLSSLSAKKDDSRTRQIVQRMELLDNLTTAYEGGSD